MKNCRSERHHLRKAIFILSVGVLVACGSTSGPDKAALPSNAQRGYVLRNSDGDTLHVMIGDKDTRVRLLGVDTPETHDPRKPVQCYGPEAAAFTHSWAVGRVTVTTEPSSGDVIDKYGRTLAYVSVVAHRADLGATLVRRGFARVYAYGNRHFVKRPYYERLEALAQAKHRGRWGAC